MSTLAEKLGELKAALEAGALTSTEYDDSKQRVLDSLIDDGRKTSPANGFEAAQRGVPYGAPTGLGTDNLLLLSDSYKVSHFKQYPKGTKSIYSYFESRGGRHVEVCFFGLQYFMKRYLTGQVVTREKIDEAEAFYGAHFPYPMFPREKWEYILEKHGGKLPVVIRAVPEGTVVPYKNVLMTVENTDPECFWLTNYLETLLVQVWYPMTVASNSRVQKKVCFDALKATSDCDLTNPFSWMFMLNDFGFRGVSSTESAAIGGAAHLVNFRGGDTVAANVLLAYYYNSDPRVEGQEIGGYSVAASEHSTMTSWGPEAEYEAFKNMLLTWPTGPVACVSDSYNIWKACGVLRTKNGVPVTAHEEGSEWDFDTEEWGTGWASPELKALIMGRDAATGGRLIVRPDSGHPETVDLRILDILGDERSFGHTVNSKGFKVLPDQIRIIQGDGIDYLSIKKILDYLAANGWSAENINFGSGGGLLQKMNRDTQKCAFKCAAIIREVDGADREDEVQKNPISGNGKKSKAGRLSVHRVKNLGPAAKAWLASAGDTPEEAALIAETKKACKIENGWVTFQKGYGAKLGEMGTDELVTVYENGMLVQDYTLEEIRARADEWTVDFLAASK